MFGFGKKTADAKSKLTDQQKLTLADGLAKML